MRKTPCEEKIYEILPMLRKQLVCALIKEYGLTQSQAAQKMGLTPAAISQYQCKKRAHQTISDQTMLAEIKKSADLIYENGEDIVAQELCRLCKIIHSN